MEDHPITRKDTRLFGLILGSLILIIVSIRGYRAGWNFLNVHYFFYCVGIILFLTGAIFPMGLKPLVFLARKLFQYVMRGVFILFFYLLFTPYAVIMRTTGKRFLDIDGTKDRKTYWKKHLKWEEDKSRFERQY